MRTFGKFVGLVCLVWTVTVVCGPAARTTASAQAPAPDAAAAVLAAAREALGGEKKLAAVKTVVATGRTRQIRGNNLVPIEFEIAIELPDKYVRKDEIPAQKSDPTTSGFNGDELLQLPVPSPPPARAGGPPPPTADQQAAARRTRLGAVKHGCARLALCMLSTSFSGYPLTYPYVGKAEAPQGKADVIDVKGPPGPGAFTARLFVHADTHLPIMITWQAPAPPARGAPPRGGAPAGAPAASAGPPPARGDAPPAAAGSAPPPSREGAPPAGAPPPGAQPAPPESRLYFADYREVSGLQLPFRLRRAVGPDTIEETTFDGFKINPKIDPKKFEVRK